MATKVAVVIDHGSFKDLDDKDLSERFFSVADEDLKLVRQITSEYQNRQITERMARTHSDKQNQFQKGDYVTFRVEKDQRTHKLQICEGLG